MKGEKATMNGNILSKTGAVLKTGITGILLLLWSVGCSSGPSQSPEKFIQGFIEKHLKMIDVSVTDYYVNDEKARVKDLVTNFIQSKKEDGTLDSIRNAVYDLSKVNVKVLDQKELYVSDEPKNFAKVEAKGEYMVTMGNKSVSFNEDEIFILQAVGHEWKVTEKANPWK